MSEVDLEAMFSSYGKVISTRILRDPQGTSRGVGFARMDTKETCDSIINAFNGKYLNGSSIPTFAILLCVELYTIVGAIRDVSKLRVLDKP